MGSQCCKCCEGNSKKPAIFVAKTSNGFHRQLPVTPERYRVEARGNVVQLTLKHTQKEDAGHYSLIAKRISGRGGEQTFSKKIQLNVDEHSTAEDGDPPAFVRRLSDLTVKVGTRTRFLVEIRSSTIPKITWHRNDTEIQPGARFSFVHEGNFYCVDVAPVTVDDHGHWTCMAENGYGRSSCTSHLNVIVPKAYKKPEFVAELCALLTETGTVSLECKVIGVPTPVLRWFKDDKEIKAGDVFALTANADDSTSLGTYTCEASNCMGVAFSTSRVHVVGKGSREGSLKPADPLTISGTLPIFKTILRDESCRIGESLCLSCQVQVPPWPKEITWYNKEGRVDPNEKYHIIEDGLGTYSIEINPTEAMDEGEWKCVATSVDNVKQFTTCYVAMFIPKNYRKPRFMESLKAVLTEEGLVSFECKVVGFPTPLLRWFKDGQELKPGDVYQLTGTNSLGSYCCIARNGMGEARSIAELTVEDIQNQLNEEERLQLLTMNQPPKFIKGLRSYEARISEKFQFTVQVSIMPEPSLSWYRDDVPVDENDKYQIIKETLGICHLEVQQLEFIDQAEWKCVASNNFGHSVTSCFLKLIIPKHYKQPKFLESLRAILSEEGTVNLECKVIGVPQPILKWYKDGEELKPGDIHRITSGQDGTCCLGTYTCEAINCMGTISSSASLLGFEDRTSHARITDAYPSTSIIIDQERELARHLSLSTIHEERTSQLHETIQTENSVTLDDRGEVSFSFDGKEVSVSLYETPDLTEEEALQVVEMYADQLSEHVTEHNVIELPPMRFTKETSTSGNLLMEAVVIDVSPDYFITIEEGDDLRTEVDMEDMSIMDDQAQAISLSSPPLSEARIEFGQALIGIDGAPVKPPRRKSGSGSSKSERSEKSDKYLVESESYHSAREAATITSSTEKKDDIEIDMDMDSEAFADAISSGLSRTDSYLVGIIKTNEEKRRSGSTEVEHMESSGSNAADLSYEAIAINSVPSRKSSKKKKRKGSCDESFNEKRTRRSESTEADSQRSSIKNNKERSLDTVMHLTEPILTIRKTLIHYEILQQLVATKQTDEEQLNAFMLKHILDPVQKLCDEVTTIEAKALQNAGDRSLAQTTRVSLLETVSGPTEELLRGVELIKQQSTITAPKYDLMVLDSLMDPVDEILSGLSKFQYELSGHAGCENPIILERTRRAVLRLGEDIVTVVNTYADLQPNLLNSLSAIYQNLNFFLDKITINPISGAWTENIDAVLVETLSRPLEELEHVLTAALHETNSSKTAEKLITPISELLARLDALVVALEGYETDYRTDFVVTLKSAVVSATEELAKLSESKSAVIEEPQTLPEAILDPLIDVQSSVSSILRGSEEFISDKELVLSLSELRQCVSNIAQTATTLKEDDTIHSLLDLQGPLMGLRHAMLADHSPEELSTIQGTISPIEGLKQVVQTVLNYIEGTDVLKTIHPIHEMLEEIQEQIPTVLEQVESAKYTPDTIVSSKENILDEKMSLEEILNIFQVASKFCDVHYGLSNAVKQCQTREKQGIVASPIIVTRVEELRQSIGSMAVTLDNLSNKAQLIEEDIIYELSKLKEPLLNLQTSLLIEGHKIEEHYLLHDVITPILRLKAVIYDIAEHITQSETLTSIVESLEDIEKDASLLDKKFEEKAHEKIEMVEGLQIITPNTDDKIIDFTLKSMESKQIEAKIYDVPDNLKIAQDNKTNQYLEAAKEISDQVSMGENIEYLVEESVGQQAKVIRKPTILQMAKEEMEKLSQEEQMTINDVIKATDFVTESLEAEIKQQTKIHDLPEILQMAKTDETRVCVESAQEISDKALLGKNADNSVTEIVQLKTVRDQANISENSKILQTAQSKEITQMQEIEVSDITKLVTEQIVSTLHEEDGFDESTLVSEIKIEDIAHGTLEEVKDLDTTIIDTNRKVINLATEFVESVGPTEQIEIHDLPEILKMAQSDETNICSESVNEVFDKVPLSEHIDYQINEIVETKQDQVGISKKLQILQMVESKEVSQTEQGEIEKITKSVEEIASVLNEFSITQEREFVCAIIKSLNDVQNEISTMLEEFEQHAVTPSICISRLGEALEMLRRTVLNIKVNISSNSREISNVSSETLIAELAKNKEIIVSSLKELQYPLLEVQQALLQKQEHGYPELLLLTKLEKPMQIIEYNILQSVMQAKMYTIESADSSNINKLKAVVQTVKDIEQQLPQTLHEVSNKQQVLCVLREITRPLEIVRERINNLELSTEETLEKDVAAILSHPIGQFKCILTNLLQNLEILENLKLHDKNIVLALQELIGPLVEFQSALSVVRSGRRSLIPETALLEERKNVIYRSVEGLKNCINEIIDEVKEDVKESDNSIQEAVLRELKSLNIAMSSVLQQVSKTDYGRKPSKVGTLKERTLIPLNRLENILTTLENHPDKACYEVILNSFETFKKQVQVTQGQLNQVSEQPLDEEAIVESFLYPINRLLSSLSILKDIQNNETRINPGEAVQLLQTFGETMADFGSSLSVLRREYIQEDDPEKASIIETLTAIIEPLENIKETITVMFDMKQKIQKAPLSGAYATGTQLDSESRQAVPEMQHEVVEQILDVNNESISEFKEDNPIFATTESIENVPLTITTVQVIVDELIEVSQRQTESLMLVEVSKSIEQSEDEESTIDNNEKAHLQERTKEREDVKDIEKTTAQSLEQIIETLVEYPMDHEKSNLETEEGKDKVFESRPIKTASIDMLSSIEDTLGQCATLDQQVKDRKFDSVKLEQQSQEAFTIETIVPCETLSSLPSEKQDSVFALWPLIHGPLDELKQCIATVIEEQMILEEAIDKIDHKNEAILGSDVLQQLVELQTSIAAVQQLSISMTEQFDEVTWQEENFPALQSLARSLEELGEHLPITATQVVSSGETIEMTESLSDDNVATHALGVLVAPLQGLRECLCLVVQEHQIVEPEADTEDDISAINMEVAESELLMECAKNIVIKTHTQVYESGQLIEEDDQDTDDTRVIRMEVTERVIEEDVQKKSSNAEKQRKSDGSSEDAELIENQIEHVQKQKDKKNKGENICTEADKQLNKDEQVEYFTQKQEKKILNEEHERIKATKEEQIENPQKQEDQLNKKAINQSNKEKEELLNKAEMKSDRQDKKEILEMEEAECLKKDVEKKLKDKTESIDEDKQKKLQKENAEHINKDKKEKLKKEETEFFKKEEQENLKSEETERLKKEEDETLRKTEAEHLKKEEEEKLKAEEANRLKKEDEEKLKKQQAECLKQEEENLKRKEAESLKREEDETLRKAEDERLKKKEEEKLKAEETERLKKKEEEKLKKEQAERLKQEEENLKREEAERLKNEEGEALRKAATERLKKEEEEKLKAEESERLKKEEQETLKKEKAERLKKEEENLKREEAERLKKEEEEILRKAEVERLKKEEEEKLKAEEADRVKKEEQEKLKNEQAERLKKEHEENLKREEVERLKKEEDEALRKAETQRIKKEEEEKLKAEESERLKKEKEEKLKNEQAERLMKQHEENLKREEAERLKKEEDEALRKAETQRIKKEEEEKLKAEESERLKKEKEEKLKNEQAERLMKEHEENLKREEAERLKKEEEATLRKAEDERLKKEGEEKLKAEESERLKKMEEEKLKKEQAERLKQEEENLKREEADRLKKEEEQKLKAVESERLEKEEEEKLKKEQAERLKEEEENIKREEAERQKKQEEEKLKAEEADRLKKEEEEKLKNEQVERLKKEHEENLTREKAERRKKEEDETLRKAEAERLKKEEEEKLKAEESERLKKEEEEKLKNEQAERLKKEHEENLKREEAERLKKEEEATLRKAEDERLKKKEEEKLKAEESERLKKKEEEKLKKEQAERLKQEEENLKREEAERLKKEEDEASRKTEDERLKKEEEEKLKAEESERLKKEEQEKLKKEQAERLKKEEENLKREEAERFKKEKEEKLKAEESERLKKEKEEKLKNEQAERLKKEHEENRKREEAERLKKEEEATLRKAEDERLKKYEEEKLKTEESERLKKKEEEKLRKEQAERLMQEEENLKREEAERFKKEEDETLRKTEAEHLKKEEEEKLMAEESERWKKEEEEKLKNEQAECLKKEYEENLKREEAGRLKKEEEEALKKAELERLKKEEEEKLKAEEVERLKKEEEEKLIKEQAESLKKEVNLKREETERLKKEEEERLRKAEVERLKKEEEEKLKAEEADRVTKEEQEKLIKESAECLKNEQEETASKLKTECLKKKKEEILRKEDVKCLKEEEEEKLMKEKSFMRREVEDTLMKIEAQCVDKKGVNNGKMEDAENHSKNEEQKFIDKESDYQMIVEGEQLMFEERLHSEKKYNKKKEDNGELKLVEKETFDNDRVNIDESSRLEAKEDVSKNDEPVKIRKEKRRRSKKSEQLQELNEDVETTYLKESKDADIIQTVVKHDNDSRIELTGNEKINRCKLQSTVKVRNGVENTVNNKEKYHIDDQDTYHEKSDTKSYLMKNHVSEKFSYSNDDTRYKRDIKSIEIQERKQFRTLKDKKVTTNDVFHHKPDIDDHFKNVESDRYKVDSDSTCDSRIDKRIRRIKDADYTSPYLEDMSRFAPNRYLRSYKSAECITDRVAQNIDRGITKMRSIDVESKIYRHHDYLPCSIESSLRTSSTLLSDYSSNAKSNLSLAGDRKRLYASPGFDTKWDSSLYDRYKKSYEPMHITVSSYDDDHLSTFSDASSLNRSKKSLGIRSPMSIQESDSSLYYSLRSKSRTPERGFSDRGRPPSFCTRLTNCTVSEGNRIKLTCTAIGNPEPEVYWTKNGEKLYSRHREYVKCSNGIATLEIHAALPEDSGYYACVAKNIHGQSSTESSVRVYAVYESPLLPSTFTCPIKDTYKFSDHELILECRIRGQSNPSISWLKDDILLCGERYKQSFIGDGICRLQISNPDINDSGMYTCNIKNKTRTDQIRHVVHFEGRENRFTNKRDRILAGDKYHLSNKDFSTRPRFSSFLADHSVPSGGTIALQVEVKGMPTPEITWLRRDGEKKEPLISSNIRTFSESGVHTLIVPEATESETGTYVCRASNAYGHVDTSAMVEVINISKYDGACKPAMFVSRPADKVMTVTVGEDVSVSFRISGIPKPRVIWMKGMRDITDGPRSHKDVIDDYVRLTLNRTIPSDEGTYCILVKNIYGCDRAFFSVKVKQRARSLTPTPCFRLSNARELEEEHAYLTNVPGPISSEPVVVDGDRNWLSLTWGKAEQRGPAPVTAYKVDAWIIGGDGGARWKELGITPINSFDAFNLRPGVEYKFRITPRNRHGWGESVTSSRTVALNDFAEMPEFSKILPGQLKVLEGSTVKLDCEVKENGKIDVRWYRENTEIDSNVETKCKISCVGTKHSLTLENIKNSDSGKYSCVATTKTGRASTFARVLIVNDPYILKVDEVLRNCFFDGPSEEGPPQFTMRLRDRRVQVTYPVRLTCQVLGNPTSEVTWYKNGKEISEDETHIFWKDESHFFTLEITRTTLEDSGCYIATAKNINGSVSCRCVLVVDKGIRAYIAPEFLCGLDVTYTVKIGGELRLSAQIEAYPSVGVVWHRDGIRLRPNRRAVMTLNHSGAVELSLANVTPRDVGIYSCTAMNEVGRAETSTRVSILGADERCSSDRSTPQVVIQPPSDPNLPYSKEPLFVTKPLSTEAVEGDTVIIFCEVVGDPKPEVIWLRDFLKPDYYRDAPYFRRIGDGPQYRLEIPYVKLDFTGTYSVIAKNCHGEAKAIISLQIYAKGQGRRDSMEQKSVRHGQVLSVPLVKKQLRHLKCCDGDAVTFECKFYTSSEQPCVRWEKSGKALPLNGDFSTEFDGETARLKIQHVYPEDEGEYTCIASNELGKAFTSACLIVDVPEEKENVLSQPCLTRPVSLLSAGSTPRSTPRSTPIRSLSPAISHGCELRTINLPRRGDSGGSSRRRPRVAPPKFYTIPHNRVAEEGETVHFQCAISGHPVPWVVWDKDGMSVTPSARIAIKEKDDMRILEISEVTMEDAGLYRVTLENDIGRTEATARLEIIGRHSLMPQPVRTRSASPRTYPSFSRSLLSTSTRMDGRLQLQCDFRGTPSPTPSWYRNGKRIERSSRIKKYFDGKMARLEISQVRQNDVGEYICEATNLLGSTRTSCKVNVLDSQNKSTADKDPPRFLQPLSEESIVMEGHSYELQTRLAGTPPFSIVWLKDGHKVLDSDYYRYVVYEDGGIALRLAKVHPLDAGEYTCIVRNDFGKASCNGLFVVQDYKGASKKALRFTKIPVPVFTAKGETACFCARIDSERPIEIDWTINGKNAKDDYRCKIDKDGPTSILRISDVSYRDCGEVRCTACVSGGRGPSISCASELRINRFSQDGARTGLLVSSSVPSSPRMQRKTGRMVKARSLDRQNIRVAALCLDRLEKITLKNRHSSIESERSSRSIDDSDTENEKTRNNAKNRKKSNCRSVPISIDSDVLDERNGNVEMKFDNVKKSTIIIDEKSDAFVDDKSKPTFCRREERLETQKEAMEGVLSRRDQPVVILEAPEDVIALRGSKVLLSATYQGYPEPIVKWLRAGRELVPSDRIAITINGGVSCLTLDNITSDQAGKYAVFVENTLGRDCRFTSVAVEGPPEPPAGRPSVSLSIGNRGSGMNVTWCSPPYDGGCALTGYSVEMRRVDESSWTLVTEACHSLSYIVTNLEPEETYQFRVRAVNVHGASEPSAESSPIMILRETRNDDIDDDEESEYCKSDKIEPVTTEDINLFGDRYDVLEELGKGRYGIVRRVVENSNGQSFAAKFVRTIKAADRRQVHEEIRIMNLLRHPKLLRLMAAFESPREIVMVTEYISGGELFERVVADDFTLTERDSILFIRQICAGVKYMHKNNVVHLDLKPENIMCHTRTSHRIKLIDFGLAQILKPDTPIRVLFGTPEFIPPEIINYEPISTESDMWSVGVICYVLLSGSSPFVGDNDAETFTNIVRADYDFDDEAFDAISQDAKDFISTLLIKKKELRMSAEACLEHPWIAQHTENMSNVALPTEKLKKFIVRRKWQKTGNALRALGRMAMLSNSRRSPSLSPSSSPTDTSSHFFDEKSSPNNISHLDEKEHDEHKKKVSLIVPDPQIDEHTVTDNKNEQIENELINSETQSKIKESADVDECEVKKSENVEVEKLLKMNGNSGMKKVNFETENKLELNVNSLNNFKDKKSNFEIEEKSTDNIVNYEDKISNLNISEMSIDNENEKLDVKNEECKYKVLKSLNEEKSENCELEHSEAETQISTCTLMLGRLTLPIADAVKKSRLKSLETTNEMERKTQSETTSPVSIVSVESCLPKRAFFKTNSQHEEAEEAEMPRITGINRTRFHLHTGNVSRTARMFEMRDAVSSAKPSMIAAPKQTQRKALATATVIKPHSERIQKAFAFWNK